ncbi:MAG: sialidase family protein [Planctomycetia bacterium]|nr:sialidase family protein [Planctomycetia bacterium]
MKSSCIFVVSLVLFAGGLFAQEGKEYPTDAMSVPPVLRPVPGYLQDSARKFQSAPSLTVSPQGRLWVAWHTGTHPSEGEENCHVVASSGDGGESWSEPLFATDMPGPLRTLDPGLWTDPNGKVWLFFAYLYGQWDGRGGIWVMSPVDPEDEHSDWSAPRRICHGFMKNKPLVTSDGRWLFPVEFMAGTPCNYSQGKYIARDTLPKEVVFDLPELNNANVFESLDQLHTVHYLGQANVPKEVRSCYEHMVVEKRDGTLWLLCRVAYGIGESFSRDGGKTWTELVPSRIANPDSRFFIGRLASGNLLLVKNGPVDTQTGREKITAFVSKDDGQTWLGGLVLDPRNNVSYPDAVQGQDGTIYVVNDYSRYDAKEIVLHRFREEDVLAGSLVSQGSRLGIIVNKAGSEE